MQKNEILRKIHNAMISRGFILEENNWKAWEKLLSEEELKDRKLERTYSHGDIKLSYSPDNFNHIRLNFYEYNKKQFSSNAINSFYDLKIYFSLIGLNHLSQTEDDLKSYRPIKSPEDFNNDHPLPTRLEKAKEILIIIVGVVIYTAIMIVPFWYWLRKLFNKYNLTVNTKRFLFSLTSLIVIFPFPAPMTMFGPLLLMPGIISLPLLYELPTIYIKTILISSVTTGALSAMVSLWFLKNPLTRRCS